MDASNTRTVEIFPYLFISGIMIVISPNLTYTHRPVPARMTRVVLYEPILYVWPTHNIMCVCDAMWTKKVPHIKGIHFVSIQTGYTWVGYGIRRTQRTKKTKYDSQLRLGGEHSSRAPTHHQLSPEHTQNHQRAQIITVTYNTTRNRIKNIGVAGYPQE
jgi:hypothetical protein